MSTATASIRELRTDFRLVKRKIEEHGEITITDNGQAAYVMKPVPVKPAAKRQPMPDYYARVVRRQPRAMTEEETQRFWEEERGDR
jgi:antitoxin (DNA-binding transcriptional repressor) of toxin-antitoxin stability system